MPARNVVKIYTENGFYHIYNRGVEKRKIFLDNQDYSAFLNHLEIYLDPNLKVKPSGLIHTKSVADEVDLIAYCLMPNHFHLFLKQTTKNGVTKFLRRILTSYVLYFNKKYEREGSLFQGKPKGVLIESEPYFLHLTRYIHLNPSGLKEAGNFKDYPYSSYKEYVGARKKDWVKPDAVLNYFKTNTNHNFKNINSYEKFVSDYGKDSSEILGILTLE